MSHETAPLRSDLQKNEGARVSQRMHPKQLKNELSLYGYMILFR